MDRSASEIQSALRHVPARIGYRTRVPDVVKPITTTAAIIGTAWLGWQRKTILPVASFLLVIAGDSAMAAHWELVAVSGDHSMGVSVAMEGIDNRSGFTTAWVKREHWAPTGATATYDLIAFDCKQRQLGLLQHGLSAEPLLTGPTLTDFPFKPTFVSPEPDSIDFTLVSALCGKSKT
jgi:hypothetical protein